MTSLKTIFRIQLYLRILNLGLASACILFLLRKWQIPTTIGTINLSSLWLWRRRRRWKKGRLCFLPRKQHTERKNWLIAGHFFSPDERGRQKVRARTMLYYILFFGRKSGAARSRGRGDSSTAGALMVSRVAPSLVLFALTHSLSAGSTTIHPHFLLRRERERKRAAEGYIHYAPPRARVNYRKPNRVAF